MSDEIGKQIRDLQRQLRDCEAAVDGSGGSSNYSGSSLNSDRGYGRHHEHLGKGKCMSGAAIVCIVIVVLLVVAAVICGITLTVRNQQQTDFVVVAGAGGGPSSVALNQRHNLKQMQTQTQRSVELERQRREAAFSHKHLAQPHAPPRPPSSAPSAPVGMPAPGSPSSPRAVDARAFRAQQAGAGGSRLMTNAASLPRPQPQARSEAPQARSASPQSRLQVAPLSLSAQNTALRPLGGGRGTSTRLAASATSATAASATGRNLDAIRKSLQHAGGCAQFTTKSNKNTYNSGIGGGLAEFRNEALVRKAAQVARELKMGLRCGPAGSGSPDAAIAGFADQDMTVC